MSRDCVSAAHLAQKGLNGSLTLGILRDNFEPFLPHLFKTFHNSFPQIALSLRGYSHSRLLAAFEFGEVDAILNYMQIPSTVENEELIVLRQNRQCVITALPNIHAGNIMGKMLTVTFGAKLAGFVVGAKCPVVMTSRGSSAEEKYLSIVISALVSQK